MKTDLEADEERKKVLRTPLSESDVLALKLGDIVYLSGEVFTARDLAHARIIASDLSEIPIKRGSVIFHCGPIVVEQSESQVETESAAEREAKGEAEDARVKRKRRWHLISAGPTTSARMNETAPEVIEKLQIRAIIGKGGMGNAVREAMRRNVCVYLAMTGGIGVLAATRARIVDVHWTDLGLAEAVWQLHVENLGPLIVSIDARGESLYDKVLKNARAELEKAKT